MAVVSCLSNISERMLNEICSSLLNLLDQEEFESEEEFLQKYGDIKAAEQVVTLCQIL